MYHERRKKFMDLIKIGKFISTKRKEKKITQEQLAERLGVSDRTVGNWKTVETCLTYLYLNHYVMN